MIISSPELSEPAAGHSSGNGFAVHKRASTAIEEVPISIIVSMH
jgi:hypothetical protein